MGRIGIYVDAVNVTMNGGYGMRYDVLRKFASRCGGAASRLNVYLSYDEERLQNDHDYRKKTQRFCDMLRDFEYKVMEKRLLPTTIMRRAKRLRNLPSIWTWQWI